MARENPAPEGARGRGAPRAIVAQRPTDRSTVGGIDYSRGRNTYDAWPGQRTAASFEAFADAVLADRSRAKGEAWISAPFKPNSDGRCHRCRDGVLPRRFLAFDLDGATTHGFAELCMYLSAYRGFGYTTASHSTKNPRARFVLELSRPVDRAEGIRLGEALQRQVEARLGSRTIKLDSAVYRGEQPLYGPLVSAEVMRYDGDPIDVDEVVKDAPPPKERPQARPTDDPYRAALLDRGLVLRELRPGKDAITCPFAEDHSEATSDTSTAYFWPRHGGYQWGGIHCLHSHCTERNRDQRFYLEKLGLDPRSVWRGQAGDLPPLGVYAGDAAREGAKAPAGGDVGSDNGAAPAVCESRVVVVRGDALSVEPIRWQWKGWIARGKLHMLAGAPGAGKSTIALTLAAVVTTGGRWPDGTKCDPGDVLVWSGEDDPADTLLPRLLVAGGDPKRFHIVKGTVDRDGPRQFDPATDIPALITEARKIPDRALIIVDPVVTVVPGDSHKNAEVRRALQPLVGSASDLNAAVFGISHFTKGTAGRDPVERVTGSVAFGALPRVVMAAARVNEGGAERRIFCRAKSNIGPDTGGWEYQVALADVAESQGVTAVYARWGQVLEGSARDLLAEAETTEDHEERGKLADAVDWLKGLLKDGLVDSTEIRAAAKQSGIAWMTVERAKPILGAKAIKASYSGGWRWGLPDHIPREDDTKDIKHPNVDGLDGLGKPTPLKPSCGAGSTEGRQAPEADGLRSNPGGVRVPGIVKSKTVKTVML